MPVFNGEAYLSDAIQSVLAQSVSDLELVLVDDGSRDNSRAIAERFAHNDARVTLLANDQNLGIARALNRGWRAAEGRFIARLDADDVALPDRFVRQIEFLDAHPAVGAVGGAAIVVDAAGRRGSTLRFPTSSTAIQATLLRHNCLAHPSVMLRRAALEEVGGYRFDHVEDYDLWLRLSERFELANLPEPMILYRIHPDQLSLLALEQKERPRLVVRESALARRTSRHDPLAGVVELTPQVLASVEIDEKELARCIKRELLGRAAILAEFDREEAERLVALASPTLGPRATKAFAAARELKHAESLLGAKRPLAGAMHVATALRHEPRYTLSRITAWLGDRLSHRRLLSRT